MDLGIRRLAAARRRAACTGAGRRVPGRSSREGRDQEWADLSAHCWSNHAQSDFAAASSFGGHPSPVSTAPSPRWGSSRCSPLEIQPSSLESAKSQSGSCMSKTAEARAAFGCGSGMRRRCWWRRSGHGRDRGARPARPRALILAVGRRSAAATTGHGRGGAVGQVLAAVAGRTGPLPAGPARGEASSPAAASAGCGCTGAAAAGRCQCAADL